MSSQTDDDAVPVGAMSSGAGATPTRHRLILHNVGWLAGERLAQFAAALLVGALVARYLGPTRYGLLTYASAYTALLVPLGTAAQTLIVRDLVRSPDEEATTMGTSAVLSFATLSTAAALVLLIGTVSGSSVFRQALPLLLLLFAGMLVRPLQVVDYWFQVHLRAKQATLARNGALLTMAGARCVLVLLRAPVWAFAAAMSAEIVLGIIAQLVIYARRGDVNLTSWRVSAPMFRRLTRESAPLIVASISVVIYMRIDQVMLGALSTRAENGLYAVATSLSEVSYFIPVAVMTSLAPVLSELHARDRDLFMQRLQQVFAVLAAAGYGVMIVSMSLAQPLVSVLFGPEYAGTIRPFVILTISVPFVFIGTAQNLWNILEGRQLLALLRALIGSVLNVGLNFYLLPRYGAVGAAVTTVVAQVTTSYAGNVIARPTRQIARLETRALLLLDLRKSAAWLRSTVSGSS